MTDRNKNSKFHILFVCWGNICRSPAAEATFRKMIEERNLGESINCDSAGTINQHRGNPPDQRMQTAAKARGIPIGGQARMVNDHDFEKADLLLTMDNFNFSELSSMSPNEGCLGKIRPFCEYVEGSVSEVPDPYYGGASGFEKVLDLLDEGCRRLLDELEAQLS